MQNDYSSKNLLKKFIEIIEEKKAINISVIDVNDISDIADYLIICCGNSNVHIKTIAKWIKFKIKKDYLIYPLSIDGNYSNDWIVLDYNNIIIHVMSDKKRSFYNIEDFWKNMRLYKNNKIII